ncbi:synaptotagmin-like protein 2 isoform X2 [Xiphophorus hellerii]|nr:synaptotagmin-like protein 2 isoform X2 [Xiphophorus hellerii]
MKVRRNPFNSEQIFEENKIQLLDEATDLTLSQNQKTTLSPESCIFNVINSKINRVDRTIILSVSSPVLKSPNNQVSMRTQDCFFNGHGSSGRCTGSHDQLVQSGNMLSATNTESVLHHPSPQSQINLAIKKWSESRKLDLSSVPESVLERKDGEYLEEKKLLDIKHPGAECPNYLKCHTDSSTCSLLLQQSQVDLQDGELKGTSKPNLLEHEADQHPIFTGCAENPITSSLARLSSRIISSSKSLENFTSETIQVLSDSTTMKSRFSVFSLQQQKTDYDSPSRSTLVNRINASSSNSSLSSAMASMSSMSSSISTIYPLDQEVQGSIQFAVNYIQKIEEFQVFVVKCSGLAVTETKKNYDLYVKCYLVPDNTRLGKRKTTVKKKTFHPTYNEVLKFKISLEELKKQNLNVSVWHNDLFGRNSFLGDIDLDLSEWDFDNMEINEYALKAKVPAEIFRQIPSNLKENGGKMRVALKFVPQTIKGKGNKRAKAGELLIWVKDCKDLLPVRGVIINPFLKCTVLPDTSRKNQQKTRVVKRTANPLFNHTMMYDGFLSEDLGETCAEITVWDNNRLQNHFIGGVRLGPGTGKSYGMEVAWMDSTTTEANLWRSMLQSNGEWVEDILPLRMLVMAKSMSA